MPIDRPQDPADDLDRVDSCNLFGSGTDFGLLFYSVPARHRMGAECRWWPRWPLNVALMAGVLQASVWVPYRARLCCMMRLALAAIIGVLPALWWSIFAATSKSRKLGAEPRFSGTERIGTVSIFRPGSSATH